MQRIPTVYGFSIIILVFVLMILNHFIYLAILERAYAAAEGEFTPAPTAQTNAR